MVTDIKIYYNKYYYPYKCECYMIYISDVGMYISTDYKIFFVIDQINFEIDMNNSDNYALSRGFNKVVHIDNKLNKVNWINEYNNDLFKNNMINNINKSLLYIKDISTEYIPNKEKIYISLLKISKLK